MKNPTGGQTPTFESATLVWGFGGPHLNQDFWSAGSTPKIPSVLGGPWRKTAAPGVDVGVHGGDGVGRGDFRNPPFSIPGGPGPPFESATLVWGSNPQNPQRFGGSVAEFKCCRKALWGSGAAEGGPGPPQRRARRFQAKTGGDPFVFSQC